MKLELSLSIITFRHFKFKPSYYSVFIYSSSIIFIFLLFVQLVKNQFQKLLILRPKMFFFQLGRVKKIYLFGGSPSATYSTYVRLGVTILLPVLKFCKLGQPRFPFMIVCLLFLDVIYIKFIYEIVLKSKHNNYCSSVIFVNTPMNYRCICMLG